MADTAIEITAGSGTNVDTRTESTNGHHRQVIVIGDPSINTGVAQVDATSGLKVNLGSDNDVTVTGTVDLGAVDNAVLDSIKLDTAALVIDAAANETLLNTIAGDTTSIDGKITTCNTGAVTITSSVLPTGAATSSNQSTIIGHIDGIETVLGTIDGDTSSLAGCVGGTELQVDIVSSALPTGAATAAKQDTGNTSLSSIDGKITACNTGAVVLAAGTAEVGKLAAGTALIGKVGIDQVTANANEVVVKSGNCVVDLGANNDVTVTNSTASNLKAEVVGTGTFAVQATLDAETTKVIGTVNVAASQTIGQTAPSTIGSGTKDVTTAGTRVALAASTTCKKVYITAKETNTGKIYFGGSSVSETSGAFIYAGAMVVLDIDNLSSVYIDSEVNGEGVLFTYVA